MSIYSNNPSLDLPKGLILILEDQRKWKFELKANKDVFNSSCKVFYCTETKSVLIANPATANKYDLADDIRYELARRNKYSNEFNRIKDLKNFNAQINDTINNYNDKIEKVLWCGHSLGGVLSTDQARDYSKRYTTSSTDIQHYAITLDSPKFLKTEPDNLMLEEISINLKNNLVNSSFFYGNQDNHCKTYKIEPEPEEKGVLYYINTYCRLSDYNHQIAPQTILGFINDNCNDDHSWYDMCW